MDVDTLVLGRDHPILPRDLIPSQQQHRRKISLVASRNTKKMTKNIKYKKLCDQKLFVPDNVENPILCTYRKNEKLPLPTNTNHVENTKLSDTHQNVSMCMLSKILNKENENPKRKLTNDEIISSAEKLHTITVSEAKANLDNKVIITKYMFDRVRQYDKLVEEKIGKKRIKSYQNISKFGKPNKNLNFTVEKAFEHVLCPLFKSGFLDFNSIQMITQVHVLFEHFYIAMYKCTYIDFTNLWEQNPNWNNQKEIPFSKRMQLLSCSFYVDFNIPFMLRYLGGQYTGDDRNVEQILSNIKNKVSKNVYDDVKRILTIGAPTYLSGELSRKNFLEYWRYGNHPTINTNREKIKRVMNKEDKHKYNFTLPIWCARFIPNLHLSPQGLIVKLGKNDRLVNDASFVSTYESVCLNMLTRPEKEPELEYGSAFVSHLTRIYDLRITHPTEELLLYSDDVSGAFRWPRLNPYIATSMAFALFDSVHIPAGQVFGHNGSAQNFEPIAKARKKLVEILFDDDTLIEKHKNILKNVRFSNPPTSGTKFVQAKPCQLRQGLRDRNGKLLNPKMFMFVDDSLLVEIFSRMWKLLAASIESLFQVMGEDMPDIRRSNLSMDKYYEIICSYVQVQLGVLINTRKMTVSMTPEKKNNLIKELKAWHSARRSFVIREAGTLLGQLNNAAEVCPWARLLFANIRNSLIISLRKNRTRVYNNKKFADFIKDSESQNLDDFSILRKKFALSKIAKAIWNSSAKCFITKTLRAELKLLADIMQDENFAWETPIAHLIPRTPDFAAWGDSSIEAAGGFSVDLKFYWHIKWPESVTSRTLKYFTIRSKENEKLISINLLEYVVVIINYAIVTHIVKENNLCAHYKYQTLLNWSDNRTAICWTRKAAISTDSGKALSRIFCSLCINNNINCISDYINTKENVIADKISRSDDLFASDLRKIMQEHIELRQCKRYQLSPAFLSCLIQALLNGRSPPLGHLPETGHWCPDNDIL